MWVSCYCSSLPESFHDLIFFVFELWQVVNLISSDSGLNVEIKEI